MRRAVKYAVASGCVSPRTSTWYRPSGKSDGSCALIWLGDTNSSGRMRSNTCTVTFASVCASGLSGPFSKPGAKPPP